MTIIQRLTDFDKWMRKIKNIHYMDHNAMQRAYEKLKPQADD